MRWDDGDIAIDWPIAPGEQPELSAKDEAAASLSYADVTIKTVSPTGAYGPVTTSPGTVSQEYDLLYSILKKGNRYEKVGEIWYDKKGKVVNNKLRYRRFYKPYLTLL